MELMNVSNHKFQAMRYSTIPFLVLTMLLLGCNPQKPAQETTIAFLADVHFQDIYAKFPDAGYHGIENPKTGEYVNIRTMESQLESTRIFNENYFAFLKALDDIASKNITYVVLPGDFSDDGQPVHIRGLKKILDSYSEKYGMRFLLATGNHDPTRPFGIMGGKKDFLGRLGRRQPIFSDSIFLDMQTDGWPPIISKEIQEWGYAEIMETLGNFGFYPQKKDLYWETPFTSYNYSNYSFNKAQNAADLSQRRYAIPDAHFSIPDATYLVEPEEGLWFLALDGNVYPRKENADPKRGESFGSASIGYNNVLKDKSYLFKWIKSVSDRAEKLNKTLIVFSHYPVLDFHDGATPQIKELLVKDKMQSHRVPNESVAHKFIEAGVKIHFGGHIHINDTEIYTSDEGEKLINVQVPSLASYVPSYKTVTYTAKGDIKVNTVIVGDVKRFDELFDLYQQEHQYLLAQNKKTWNNAILNSDNYTEFTQFHLKGLVQGRFMKDWPDDVKNILGKLSGKQLLFLLGAEDGLSENEIDAFGDWRLHDLIIDLYKLRNADKLALKDIGKIRFEQYQYLAKHIKNNDNQLVIAETDCKEPLGLLFEIFTKLSNGQAVTDFSIQFDAKGVPNIVRYE